MNEMGKISTQLCTVIMQAFCNKKNSEINVMVYFQPGE